MKPIFTLIIEDDERIGAMLGELVSSTAGFSLMGRAGTLAGKRGPRGGYRLGRDRASITLGEVVRVVRNLEVETEPSDPSIGSPLAHEVVWPLWEKLREEMMAQLDNVTIEDLCQQARSKGLNGTAVQPHAGHATI